MKSKNAPPRSEFKFIHNIRVGLILTPALSMVAYQSGFYSQIALLLGLLITFAFDNLNAVREHSLIAVWVTMFVFCLFLWVNFALAIRSSPMNLLLVHNMTQIAFLVGLWGALQFPWMWRENPTMARLMERLLIGVLPFPCAVLYIWTLSETFGAYISSFLASPLLFVIYVTLSIPLPRSESPNSSNLFILGNMEKSLHSILLICLPPLLLLSVKRHEDISTHAPSVSFLICLPFYFMQILPKQFWMLLQNASRSNSKQHVLFQFISGLAFALSLFVFQRYPLLIILEIFGFFLPLIESIGIYAVMCNFSLVSIVILYPPQTLWIGIPIISVLGLFWVLGYHYERNLLRSQEGRIGITALICILLVDCTRSYTFPSMALSIYSSWSLSQVSKPSTYKQHQEILLSISLTCLSIFAVLVEHQLTTNLCHFDFYCSLWGIVTTPIPILVWWLLGQQPKLTIFSIFIIGRSFSPFLTNEKDRLLFLGILSLVLSDYMTNIFHQYHIPVRVVIEMIFCILMSKYGVIVFIFSLAFTLLTQRNFFQKQGRETNELLALICLSPTMFLYHLNFGGNRDQVHFNEISMLLIALATFGSISAIVDIFPDILFPALCGLMTSPLSIVTSIVQLASSLFCISHSIYIRGFSLILLLFCQQFSYFGGNHSIFPSALLFQEKIHLCLILLLMSWTAFRRSHRLKELGFQKDADLEEIISKILALSYCLEVVYLSPSALIAFCAYFLLGIFSFEVCSRIALSLYLILFCSYLSEDIIFDESSASSIDIAMIILIFTLGHCFISFEWQTVLYLFPSLIIVLLMTNFFLIKVLCLFVTALGFRSYHFNEKAKKDKKAGL